MFKNLIISIDIKDAEKYLNQITEFIPAADIVEEIITKNKHYIRLASEAEYTTYSINNNNPDIFRGLKADRIYIHRDIPIGFFEEVLKPIVNHSFLPLDERIYLF